jgi:ABC-2 type transport system permease protein
LELTRRFDPRRFRRNARLYLKLQLIQLRTAVEYRADFWIGIIGASLMNGAGLIFVVALFGQIDDIAGWSGWEVAILYGLALIPRGLTELFCDGPWTLRMMLNQGEFDRLLVRPTSPALQTTTQLASIHGVGQLTLGGTAFWLGVNRTDLDWTLWKAGFFLVILVSSWIMLCAINFLVNLIGFWEPSTQSAIPTAYAMLIDFAKFPLDIYSNAIKVLITVVAPYAFISYFPAIVLLDKESSWRWLGLASPLVTLIVVLLTSWLWGRALNRYQGVGH